VLVDHLAQLALGLPLVGLGHRPVDRPVRHVLPDEQAEAVGVVAPALRLDPRRGRRA